MHRNSIQVVFYALLGYTRGSGESGGAKGAILEYFCEYSHKR